MATRKKKKTKAVSFEKVLSAYAASADRRRLATVKATMAALESESMSPFKQLARALAKSGSEVSELERAMRTVMVSVHSGSADETWDAVEQRHGDAIRHALATPEVAAFVRKARAELACPDELGRHEGADGFETVINIGGRKKGKR